MFAIGVPMSAGLGTGELADLIGGIGTPAFAPVLTALLRAVAPFTYCVVFGYCGAARPIDLYDDFPAGKRAIFVSDYQSGPYLLDPFYLACARPAAPGLYRMKDVAPDRFYQGEYFRNYYIQTGLAEEIGYFAGIAGGGMVVLSLMRAERAFSARAFRALDAATPVVLAAIRKHWHDLPQRFSPVASGAGAGSQDLNRAFAGFGQQLLTAREREVVEYTLKGHSAEATGIILAIAPGTVRIHRRNIYAKLRITSQGELFALFLQTVLAPKA